MWFSYKLFQTMTQNKRWLIFGANPNENREVLVYDHFAGDNSFLKFIIKLKRKKNMFFYLYLVETFDTDATIFKKLYQKHKKLPSKVAHNLLG